MSDKMRKLISLLFIGCLSAALALPACADGYTIDPPDVYEYGKATSVETVYTADGGKRENEDVSKNAALIPPGFGTPGMDVRNYGEYLTPSLAPGGMAYGAIAGGDTVVTPGSTITTGTSMVTMSSIPDTQTTKFTEVTSDLYYADGSLGTLNIPAINLSVNVYQGTDSTALAKGAGHFEETSIWDGNVALAAHNRGVSDYFGKIHTLAIGDTVTLTTKLGTRTYAVTSIAKVSETDRGALAAGADNRVTMYTCVRNERDYRWCVVASEVV